MRQDANENQESSCKGTCKTCKHFLLHYIRSRKTYTELHYGHCVHPRLKHREADTPGCQYFTEKPEQ